MSSEDYREQHRGVGIIVRVAVVRNKVRDAVVGDERGIVCRWP
jgi:hypothetical protein